MRALFNLFFLKGGKIHDKFGLWWYILMVHSKILNNDKNCTLSSWKKSFRFTAGRHKFLMQPNFSGVFLQYLLLYIEHLTVSESKFLKLTKLNVFLAAPECSSQKFNCKLLLQSKPNPVFFNYRPSKIIWAWKRGKHNLLNRLRLCKIRNIKRNWHFLGFMAQLW